MIALGAAFLAVSLGLLAALCVTAAIESRAERRARRNLDRLRHLAGVDGHGAERYGLWAKNDAAKKAWQFEQEANLAYVAFTRAQSELTFIG